MSKTRANLAKLISVLESAALNYPKFILISPAQKIVLTSVIYKPRKI